MDHVATQLTGLTASASSPPPPTPPAASAPPAASPVVPSPLHREPYIPTPTRYSGDLGTCAQFLHQCNLVFSQQLATYSTDQSCITSIMSLCSDKAASWSLAISFNNPGLCLDFQAFTAEMQRVFDHSVKGRETVSQLSTPLHLYPPNRIQLRGTLHWSLDTISLTLSGNHTETIELSTLTWVTLSTR